jgi:DNA modification methylase
MTIEVLFGDMLEILPTLEENSFDSVVTDPPYHLTSIVKRFSKGEPEHTKTYKDIEQRSTPIARLARGFMGKSWDGGDIAFKVNTWEQVIRVLKPGGYLLCFGGTRTFHRMACAIEDAGFEIRDTIMWLYGTGFPKSLNISKQIDKKAGVEREVLGVAGKSKKGGGNICTTGMSGGEYYITASATDLARK